LGGPPEKRIRIRSGGPVLRAEARLTGIKTLNLLAGKMKKTPLYANGLRAPRGKTLAKNPV
jgi:hypothetical protein